MKQLFLPLGLILAVFFAIFLPAGGVFLRDNYGLKILVFAIFVVSGYQTGAKGLALDKKLFTLFAAAAFISLLLAPLLGLLVSKILALPVYLTMGLIIISTVPPTISSGVVITEVSRGNAVLALFLTISLNLLGIFSMPFILDLCLKVSGPVDIDQTALLTKMLFLVLLPFIIGKMMRNFTGKTSISPLWSYINSSCIILIVYSSIATSKSAFTGLTLLDYGQILTGVASIHLLLLAINMQTAKAMRLSTADSKAMIFVTSQKTLAIALAVLANVNFETGNAIIVCLMFHFFQLFVDSFLASAMQKKTVSL
jgi:solute carrier family 10 (sodium/bile acid cotransporter), member 7